MIGSEREPLMGPYDPGLAAADIGDRQVSRVTGRGGGHHEPCFRGRGRGVEEDVDTHSGEPGPQFGPRGDAVDVTVVFRLRKRMRLIPGPRRRLFDEPIDGQRPLSWVEVRGHRDAMSIHRCFSSSALTPMSRSSVTGSHVTVAVIEVRKPSIAWLSMVLTSPIATPVVLSVHGCPFD